MVALPALALFEKLMGKGINNGVEQGVGLMDGEHRAFDLDVHHLESGRHLLLHIFLLERALLAPRHVEVQVVGDGTGIDHGDPWIGEKGFGGAKDEKDAGGKPGKLLIEGDIPEMVL